MIKRMVKTKWVYAAAVILTIAILCALYSAADISEPLVFQGGDEFGVFYVIKTIRDHGWYFSNPDVGGVTGGDMYDYPYCDSLSFLLVKIISLFVSNVYLIANLFYFLNYILVALTSAYVCKKLRYGNGISLLVGILFAFTPFIQGRYAHLWLTPYFLLPLVSLVAIWIARGEIVLEKGNILRNGMMWQAIVFSFLAASTGFYYAFFTCVAYAIAWVIYFLNVKKRRIRQLLFPAFLVTVLCVGIILNVLPNVLYWMRNGTNPASELAIRNPNDAEYYALKMIQLILPRGDHRISLLGAVTRNYNANYMLVNENTTVTLGIIASVGFLLALAAVFRKERAQDRGAARLYAYFVLGLFLVGTIGGVGSIFSYVIRTPMRCYNRISLLIFFFSLLFVAELLEYLRGRCHKAVFGGIVLILICVGVFDQTVNSGPIDTTNLYDMRAFIADVEEQMDEGDLVFQLPYSNWPSGSAPGTYRLMGCYIESDKLRWSYGCMQGRPEALWQQSVAAMYTDVPGMLQELREAGYGGIYIDGQLYASVYGIEELARVSAEITDVLQTQPIISDSGVLQFWSLKQ